MSNSVFIRAMHAIGDFESPFYSEERDRDVWNEASAAGFQLMLWSGLVAAVALPWIAGSTGTWIAMGILVVVGAISWCTMLYASALNVDPMARTRLGARAILAFTLVIAAIISIAIHLRSTYSGASGVAGSLTDGFLTGAIIGAIGGAIALAVVRKRSRG
ncbi:DUF2029 domain-containing protein [Hoyosella sp. G463]|uniref:DUF2029 domain-containing protein n=1 Tax=Lolliginicoccus lacisalsi TaxID=2742202 RepID=A0A927JAW1_9ACTN|nr:DUF2029 domain-containing protein [Lolliginicoccus lacisalsi]MBD8505799.1 DUF2029 domain-containing protein [Lolliginicoccus lacisalsi]